MEINTDNGIVTLKKNNLKFRKGMFLEDLQQTEFYKKYTNGMRDVKTGYFWYYFKAINVDGYQLTLDLCFFGNQLDRIFMNTHEESDAKTWDDWTEQKEMNVFHRNTTFLSHILGIPPTRKKKTPYPSCSFRFSWGSVWSVYDPRSASSFMGINYDE